VQQALFSNRFFNLRAYPENGNAPQAIPILIDVLHGPEAPRLGFKMQTKALLGAQHQIGKELALIFDEKIEQEALEGNLLPIQNCLSNLYKRFISAGIRPESGYVLTPQTMKFIEQAPDGSQTLEKTNLTIGKFDRAIPCPQGINFFNYRDDSYISVMDQHRNDYKENRNSSDTPAFGKIGGI
jgi:hypothetical protein